VLHFYRHQWKIPLKEAFLKKSRLTGMGRGRFIGTREEGMAENGAQVIGEWKKRAFSIV